MVGIERPAIAIVGPTASGKTTLAIEVAARLGGEVISLDSRQAYRGFTVGTAAPTADELAAAHHHGIGFLEADDRYGAGRFSRLARKWMREIRGRGAIPLLVGGTGLFLRALTHPMFGEPPLDPPFRERLREWIEGRGPNQLKRWGTRLDPALADGRPLDTQRAARTTQLALSTGYPLSWWIAHGEPSHPRLRAVVFRLRVDAEDLRRRIRDRTEAMIESGAWQQEVRGLLGAGLEGSRAFNALGYRDVATLVEGRNSSEQTVERIVAVTYQYARRQRTWFRHQLPGGTISLDASRPPAELAQDVEAVWRRASAEAPANGEE